MKIGLHQDCYTAAGEQAASASKHRPGENRIEPMGAAIHSLGNIVVFGKKTVRKWKFAANVVKTAGIGAGSQSHHSLGLGKY